MENNLLGKKLNALFCSCIVRDWTEMEADLLLLADESSRERDETRDPSRLFVSD